MIQPVYESLVFGKNKLKFSDHIKAECNLDVLSSDVAKVLSVSALTLSGDSEVKEGKVKASGRVIFYLTYQSVDGEIKKSECGSEYSKTFTDSEIKEDMRAYTYATAEKTEYDLSGERVSLSATVAVNVCCNGEEQLSAVVGGDSLIADKCEICYDKRYGYYKGGYPIDEEFALNYEVKEVLSQSVKCAVSAVQCGVGSVIVDGEMYFCAMFLPKGEKRDIIREDRVIPFRMEVDAEEAMPSMRANARLAVKSFKTDIEVVPEDNKSTVTFSATLHYECEVVMETETALAQDLFSPQEETDTVLCEYTYPAMKEVRLIKKSISGRAETEELPIGARLTAVCGEKIELTSTSVESDRIRVEGVLSMNVFYKDAEANVFVYPTEVPFETVLDTKDIGDSAEVIPVIERAWAKTVSITQTEIMAEVAFIVYPTENKKIRYIKEVKSLGERKPETCALSVYISFEGERLWSLAKRLGVCPDELLATNPDLQFPLSGKERIVVYRNKQ